MDPNVKKSKKKARKAGAEAKPAEQTNVNPPAEKYNSSWEEEQLVDYEPEEPAAFSPMEEENYSEGDDYPAQGDGPEDQNDNTDYFPADFAEAVDSVGAKRSQMFFRRSSAAAKQLEA